MQAHAQHTSQDRISSLNNRLPVDCGILCALYADIPDCLHDIFGSGAWIGQMQPERASTTRRDQAETTTLSEDTHYLVYDALRCFSLVQVLNGAIASAVTFAGYLYKDYSLTGMSRCRLDPRVGLGVMQRPCSAHVSI